MVTCTTEKKKEKRETGNIEGVAILKWDGREDLKIVALKEVLKEKRE